ncbi:MAG: hypothetical protein EA359_06845 [Balneolaceae bacterium]|nr:MAG: hypothetical protein EA359_06845 [Balneolaceae bacterium]
MDKCLVLLETLWILICDENKGVVFLAISCQLSKFVSHCIIGFKIVTFPQYCKKKYYLKADG